MSEDRFVPVLDSRPQDTPWPPMAWPPAPDVCLRGRGIEVTPVDPGRDAAELFHALDSDAVWTHVAGRPRDPAQCAEMVNRALARNCFPWVIRLITPLAGFAPGAIVGMSSYLDISAADSRLEIGWTAYTPAVWASTVNPETKLLLLGHAFEVLGAGRVQLKTDVRNQRSQQAIARLGARHEGTFRRHQRRDDGTMRDTVFFAIVAEDWPAIRARLQARLA